MTKYFSVSKIIILAIIVLAFILRFNKLGQVPLSLNWDETSNAYNAYSILKTGRDEYGKLLPLYNRSFDDYKPPLYMYLNVPTVAVFGLTSFAARVPSAFFGFLTVLLIYFLTKKLFESTDSSLTTHHSPPKNIALLAMLMLAISPWHLQFSRVGFEANIGLFFLVASFTCLISALKFRANTASTKQKLSLIASGLFIGLSFYTYHTERILTPLLLLITLIIFKREFLLFTKKYIVFFFSLIIITVLPLLILTPKDLILTRFESTINTSRVENLKKSVDYIGQDQKEELPLPKIIHNRRVIIAQSMLKNYLASFDLNFLFLKGDDNPRHHIENMGMLYSLELPLILAGLYLLLKNPNRQKMLILLWLIASPVAAATTSPSPHAVRALPMVIPLTIISSYSISNLLSKFAGRNMLIMPVFLLVIFISVAVYLENYWNHYPNQSAQYWQYGNFQAVIESEKFRDQFKKINVSGNFEQAYIFWLFASKYNPATYQKVGSKEHFDNFFFNQGPPEDPEELYVNFSDNLPGNFKILKTIPLENGQIITFGRPKTLEELLQL